VTGLPPLQDVLDEYELLEGEDRYRLLIDLGRQLDPMPDALKTEATKVRGCSASVWVYPTTEDGRLHFLADSNAAITKGIVALVLSAVQDKPAEQIARMDVAEALAPFELSKHLSANRTQGVPNMIALVRTLLRTGSSRRARKGPGPRISGLRAELDGTLPAMA
jgi:cysteine desulfuration protein SufE